jgi:hypothetical protein
MAIRNDFTLSETSLRGGEKANDDVDFGMRPGDQ